AWAMDRRFADAWRRRRNLAELDERLCAWTQPQASYVLAERLQAAGVPAFPALSTAELYRDPHFRAREAWVELDHPLGNETIYGVPWKLSETPGRVQGPFSLMGADNDYV